MSKGKGIVRYILVGSQGNTREVSAIANLDKKGAVKTVRPLHQREQPLIDVLMKASVNEIIEVDFTAYNNKYPRDYKGSKTVVARTTKATDHYQESLITDLSTVKEHKLRLVKLIALSVLVLTAILFAKDGFFS